MRLAGIVTARSRAGVAARLRELALRSVTERGTAPFIPVVFSSWRDDPLDELIDELQEAIRPFAPDTGVELPRTRLDDAIQAAAAATLFLSLFRTSFKTSIAFCRSPRAARL